MQQTVTAGLTFALRHFRLDEAAHVLTVRGRDIVLQPKIFDLLVYLVRNRSRVVSKDELLDAIWPDVTVTDNSLQRAVSALRSLLREAGMEEDAVRNFPRSGYRFCLDEDAHATEDAEAGPASSSASLAFAAIAQQRWRAAADLFEKIDADRKLDGNALDQWALAEQCLGKPSKAISLLTRATTAHVEAKHEERAAASAALLATMHLERGESAVAQGWIARAQDLVTASPESAAAGYVMWATSRIAAFAGNIEHAFDLADRAYDLGRKLGDTGVEALGLMYRGFYRLCLGNTRDGLTDQDHAGALALSCRLDPLTGAALYCNILWACRSLGDWARANQWTISYQQFCTDADLDFSGSCQLHHAEVLAVQGTLNEALDRIRDAMLRLPGDAPWSLGDAHRVLGDIHAAIGNTTEAFEAYDKSYALGWSPEPGRAMLLAERGEFDTAYASLERSLEGENWRSVQQQGVLLAHLALIAALSGRRNKALALIEQIGSQSERWPMASIRATTHEASGVLASEQGDYREALQHFNRARQLWIDVDSRLNGTRMHIRIAEAQLALGDRTAAATEARIALKAANELKSSKMIKQCRQLQERCLTPLPLAS